MSFSNRLIHEKSPYLLQHARNPVDWYPWGEEAFEAARRDNKPVFLSIGYSTCHWCHVMAHESFESEEVAGILNKHFISIKVDREERPDIDHIYMTAVTSMTGQGGWPLSVFLTPDRHPFFGGTYYPPYPRPGAPGFPQVLDSILTAWKDQREQVKESAADIIGILSSRSDHALQDAALSAETADQGFLQLATRYDRVYGGFGQAPKFPSAHQLMFLMRYGQLTGKPEALQMTVATLTQMIQGGMCDHLGGGFHRYATDRQWQIPHFEKMLYDQAMISRALLEAYQITKDQTFAAAARETFDYVLRDLTSAQGAFYSAEDADSVDPYDPDPHEKKEGAFYLWKQDEITELLGPDDALVFNAHYQIGPDGNAHSDPHGDFEGKNIIFTDGSLESTAGQTDREPDDVRAILERSRIKLLKARSLRRRPHLDDKILTDWNGLMIASLAFGARILHDKRYADAAVTAADFLLDVMTDERGRLLHRYRGTEAGINASLDDYAFLVWGLLEVYQATLDARHLLQAKRLTDDMIALFGDQTRGGFYMSSKDTDDLPFRPRDIYDGAIPSGNSVAADNLLRLYRITSGDIYRKSADCLFRAFAADVRQAPMGYAHLLSALTRFLDPGREVVVAVGEEGLSTDEILDHLSGKFLPDTVVIGNREPVFPSEELVSAAPWIRDHAALNGRTTVYICERQSCRAPVTDIPGIDRLLP